MSAPHRLLIVEDEEPARAHLADLLSEDPRFALVAEASDAATALEGIRRHRPDALLLDIQLAGSSAFDLLERLGFDELPLVVFITAHEEHAVKAFELDAIDYLLKPFGRERFRHMLDRLESRLGRQVEGRGRPRLALRSPEGMELVPLDEVRYVRAASNYLRLQVGDRTLLRRETMTSFSKRLPPDEPFLRIHRSTLVRIPCVRRLLDLAGGPVIELDDGTQLEVAASRRIEVQRRLEGSARGEK